MAKLPILTLPDPVLRRKAEPVERIDDETRRLIADMFETMYAAPGIGLAAPQIGVSRRIVVLDPARGEEPAQPLALINPQILKFGDERRTHEEGCLSMPEIYAEIERPASLLLSYETENGEKCEIEAAGILATIIQHEADHLDGVMFVDHLSRLKRELLIKKFYKARREGEASL